MYYGSKEQIKIIKEGNNLLYHYTSATSLIKILQQMRLRLSTFDKLNDLNEVDMCVKVGGFAPINLIRYIKKNSRLISFSCNKVKGGRILKKAINLPSMWAHYADNNQGACIVLNKKKFIKENKKALKGKFFRFYLVTYKSCLKECDVKCVEDKFESFVKGNMKLLLCQKNSDWGGEMEYRFIYFDPNLSKRRNREPIYLSILNSIEYICLGMNFVNNEEQVKELIATINCPDNKCYGLITNHDLCTVSTSPFGYGTTDLFLDTRFNGKYKIYVKPI